MIENFSVICLGNRELEFVVCSTKDAKIDSKIKELTLIKIIYDHNEKIIFDINKSKHKIYLEMTLRSFVEREIEIFESQMIKNKII